LPEIRRRPGIGVPAVVAAALVALAVQSNGSSASRGVHAGIGRAERAGPPITRVLGYSVDHRPIVAKLIASGGARRSVLVVGSIAGDESGGTAVAEALASLPAARGVRLWLIPDMNPDGAVRGTRVNAHGVDLNRNFPFRWHPLADTDSRYFPGDRPGSEPESRAVEAFISRVRPQLTIWVHQPYGLIDDSQGPRWAEQLLSRTTGLPLARLADYPGSAIGWENHLIPSSAFDLELPGGYPSRSTVDRYAEAIQLLARTYATHRPHR
jgi:murein peptide amidase A